MLAKDYSTVIAQGSVGYLAPLDPQCSDGQRYMPVHLVSDGGWGLVDRRSGKLLGGPRATHDRYRSWSEAKAAASGLNTTPTSAAGTLKADLRTTRPPSA